MINALNYLGYGINEEDVTVGGGAPSFFFATEGFPFLGTRSQDMREQFLSAANIPHKIVKPASSAEAWNGVYEDLAKGLPVLLRVDMRYLPYLWGGKYGSRYMSFGWHYICLFSVDINHNTALVTDTAHPGFQTVKISDLDRARSSSTRVYPPKYEYAVILPKPDGWTLDRDRLLASGLAAIATHMSGTGDTEANATPAAVIRDKNGKVALLSRLEGMREFPAVISSLEDVTGRWMLAPSLSYMAGSIERNGTGGGGFRNFLVRFLENETGLNAVSRARAERILPAAKASAAAWTELSAELDRAGTALTADKKMDRAARNALCAKAAEEARKLVSAEEALYAAIGN